MKTKIQFEAVVLQVKLVPSRNTKFLFYLQGHWIYSTCYITITMKLWMACYFHNFPISWPVLAICFLFSHRYPTKRIRNAFRLLHEGFSLSCLRYSTEIIFHSPGHVHHFRTNPQNLVDWLSMTYRHSSLTFQRLQL